MKRFIFIAFRGFNDYQHTWPFNFEDFALSNYMYMYNKRNDPIITTRFHWKRNFALWKFRQSEFLPWGSFASANFRYGEDSENEISLQWMRNFAKTTAKFRLTQRKYASALTKFRGEISSNFPFLHEVVLFSRTCYRVTSTSSTFCSWCCFILYLIFPLSFLCPVKVL